MRVGIVALVAILGMVSCQDVTTKTTEELGTITTEPPKPTEKPVTTTSTPPTPPKPTTPKPTTEAPTTLAPTTLAPTTVAPTTPAPAPTPSEPTLGNYTVSNGDELCFMALMKVVVMQNATHFPLVNATVLPLSSCAADSVTVMVASEDGLKLQMTVKHDNESYFISEIAVTGPVAAERSNLTQFSVPMKQYYKCQADSVVDLGENDVKISFSEMRYQAFQKEKQAVFVGNEDACLNDHQSDIVIILIGSALTLLIVVILVAYLLARRKNRQRGYQSV